MDLVAGIEHLNDVDGNDPIQVRVGLNSGEVVVKRISDDLLLELDAVGATVALASQMERLAAPNTVLVTAATLNLAQRVVKASSRGKAKKFSNSTVCLSPRDALTILHRNAKPRSIDFC